ncbi:hypothetical protein R3P38DRAFT_3214172 [Favolaschia claudopus]|uniref:Uncharacterized protein n=1 Tax=Favolaschia claudopus TaxID=2862362 RepID=A0AAW0AAR7_9AGAR
MSVSPFRIPGPWNHETFTLFRIPGPWNHRIFAKGDNINAFPGANDIVCKFKEIDVPDRFVVDLIQAIMKWSTDALDGLPDEHKQTALRHMRISTTGFGVMNRITSPAIRNAILPLITLDLLLHAVDPVDLAPPSPRAFLRPFSSIKHKNVQNTDWYQILLNAWFAHTEREKISQRPTLNVETIADGTKRRCLSDLSMLNNNSKPGDTAMYNMTQAAFMLRAMREGKMVMTLNVFIDLALLQAQREDPSITRSEVAAILNDPNVDGICAALAVAAAISPVLLLSTQNYANATYNPSTSYWFAGGNMPRVQLKQPLGQVERVCWIALLRLSAQTISAAEALKFIFESKDVQSIIKNQPSEQQLKILEYAGDQTGYEIEEADPDDAYDREIARLAQEEKARQDKEKKEQEEHAEKERRKAAKEQAAKEKAEAKRRREEEERNDGEGVEPPSGKRMTRTQTNTLPVKVKPVEVSIPVARRAKSRASTRPAVPQASARVNKNAYIHILDNAPGHIPEHITLRNIEPLDLTASRPMDPEPLVVKLHAPQGARGCAHERTFEYHMFQKCVPQASDRKMIEFMLQSQPTVRPLFLEDSARDPNPRLQASEKQSMLYVCTEAEYAELSRDIKYEIHRHRCVLILDVHTQEHPPPFSWQTLQQFRDPDALCHIQDMGLEGLEGSQCLVAGPLNALLPAEGRPVLNAIHHPLPHQQLPLPPGLSYFCSLAAAMTFLQNHQHLPEVPSPWGDRRWGLCATALARSPHPPGHRCDRDDDLDGGLKWLPSGCHGRINLKPPITGLTPGSRFSLMDWEDVQEDAQIDVYRWEVFVLEPNMAFLHESRNTSLHHIARKIPLRTVCIPSMELK